MNGFPGVNLVGASGSNNSLQWSLDRSSQQTAAVTLAPGTEAQFGIVNLPYGSDGNSGLQIAVSKIIITPPNDYSHGQVSWFKTLLLQNATGTPGTYITPVTAGS
jgi:hypothetical protein